MSDKQFNVLCKFLIFLLIALVITFIGMSNIFALETKTIYSVNNNGTLSSANTYNYGYMTGGGTQGIARATVGNTVSGVAYGFSFSFYENIVLNKTYTMVINFKDSDLLKSFSSDMVQVSTCNNNTCNENILVSVIKNNNNGNSNKLTIQFNPITTGGIILVNLGSDQPITGVSTFGISSVTLDSSNQNEDIMNNANQNANNIINNNNSNTNTIIQNQDTNASAIQDSINSLNDNFNTISYCQNLFDGIYENGSIGTSNGVPTSTASVIRTKNFTTIEENTNYTMTLPNGATGVIFLFYNNGTYINSKQPTVSNGKTTVLSSSSANQVKWRFNTGFTNLSNQTMFEKGNVATSYCVHGTSSSVNKLDQQTNAINDLNDSINDDDIGGATQDGADFILDFDTNTFGLTSVVTAPLNLIQSLTSSTCSELELPLPFLNNKKLILPCMTTIYQNTFGSLFTMYQTITFGIIAYWVCVRIFNQVKDFKNPEHDEIEVVDL